MNKKVLFAIIGAILGIPLSYYFQPQKVREISGGIGGYFKHFGDIMENGNYLVNLLLGVVVFAIVGLVIGYFVDKSKTEK